MPLIKNLESQTGSASGKSGVAPAWPADVGCHGIKNPASWPLASLIPVYRRPIDLSYKYPERVRRSAQSSDTYCLVDLQRSEKERV